MSLSPVREYLLSLTEPFTVRGASRGQPYSMDMVRDNIRVLCEQGLLFRTEEVSNAGEFRYISEDGAQGIRFPFDFSGLLEAFGNWTVTPEGYQHPARAKRAYVYDWGCSE